MKTTPGTPGTEMVFRELKPGETFQVRWKGVTGDYVTTDLTRADPQSDQPWDFRAAVNIDSGEAIFLPATHMVTSTQMKAGPV